MENEHLASSQTMKSDVKLSVNKPMTRGEIIGQRIRCVFQRDLPREKGDESQEREIVIELESGLRFSLERNTEVLDPVTGFGLIYPYVGIERLYREIDARSDINLNSPIKAMIRPHEYKYNCGVVLENGFILIDGFDMKGNGVLFMRPCQETMALMKEFELPT